MRKSNKHHDCQPIIQSTDGKSEGERLFADWVASRERQAVLPVSSKPLGPSSKRIYLQIWQAFVRHCDAHGLKMDSLTEADLEDFLRARESRGRQSKPLSQRYAWRVLHLINRLINCEAGHQKQCRNPAPASLMQQPPYSRANASANDKAPDCFTDSEIERLIACLGTDGARTRRSAWRQARDRTAVSVMLGAGITPGDMRQLKMSDIDTSGPDGIPVRLRVSSDPALPRATPLPRWAGGVLQYWIQIRAKLPVDGELVFPSTASGKPWSHTGSQEACKKVLAEAGLQTTGGGLFRLRHSFALLHLRAGRAEKTVAGWLGYADPESIAQYRPLLAAACGNGVRGEQL